MPPHALNAWNIAILSIWITILRCFGSQISKKMGKNPRFRTKVPTGTKAADAPNHLTLAFRTLEPHHDPAADQSALAVEHQAAFARRKRGLDVEKVARIDDRLCVKRQAESRQRLRNQDAQAGIVYRKPAFEWVDREDRRIRREPIDRLDARAAI